MGERTSKRPISLVFSAVEPTLSDPHAYTRTPRNHSSQTGFGGTVLPRSKASIPNAIGKRKLGGEGG